MNYQKYANKSEKKIKQYGSPCTLIKKGTEEVYDPTTDTYSATDVRYDGNAIMSAYDIKFVNGTTILAGDVSFMCTFKVKPENSDKIEYCGKVYKVIDVKPFSPNGMVDIYYKVQGREQRGQKEMAYKMTRREKFKKKVAEETVNVMKVQMTSLYLAPFSERFKFCIKLLFGKRPKVK